MARSLPGLYNPQAYDLPTELVVPVEIPDEVRGFPWQTQERARAAHPIGENPGNRRTTVRQPLAGPGDVATCEPIWLTSRFGEVTGPKDTQRQFEDLFAKVFYASPAINCIIHLNNRRYIEINKAYEQHTGYSRAEVIGKASIGLGLWSNPDDREHIFEKLLAEGSIHEHECNSLTKAGGPLITLLSAEIIELGDELCVLIIAEDITVRMQLEDARREMDRRLMSVQEAERTRIARELHDNIGQSLALVSIQMERARSLVRGFSTNGDASLKELCGKIKDLGQTVSDLSHQLHSSELELLGLSAAVTGLCREFSEQYPVKVDCVCSDLREELGADVSLGLFRVMQEALHNIAKHSQAQKMHVELRGTQESICLTIVDDGIGFSSDNAIGRPGLGLISMRERMHLIGGDFTISSKSCGGTRIEAIVPLREKLCNALLTTELQETSRHSCFRKSTYHNLGLQLQHENVYLRQDVKTVRGHGRIVGDSAAVNDVLRQIEQVAATNSTVLLIGETGTGKELIASAIHELSHRHARPMVRVNCAAIPESLIESELFGREKGAYTGALSRQIGRFEVADGSTLFLGEASELPPEVQVKLLRVLQERQIERLGSTKTISVNVRIIAATNHDLKKAVHEKRFRDDLYYRLNVFPIRVPPLRERIEDIPLLIQSFVDEFAVSFGKDIESIDRRSITLLQRYSWPGNIRELRNTVERAMILASGPRLFISTPSNTGEDAEMSLRLSDAEREHVRSVLDKTRWRVRGKDGAAEILDLKPSTLESKMVKLGINRKTHLRPD